LGWSQWNSCLFLFHFSNLLFSAQPLLQ
jgi:hypothetical protein